jgi:hypothetical protein
LTAAIKTPWSPHPNAVLSLEYPLFTRYHHHDTFTAVTA